MRWLSRIEKAFSWWEEDPGQFLRPSAGRPHEEIVDNRTFLLGLGELYRKAMMKHERNELLGCAERVAAALKVEPADVPIEGYYTEHPDLMTYFRLVRALQAQSADRASEVEPLPEFRRLLEITSSSIFGPPVLGEHLLPPGRDPLSAALKAATAAEEWTVPRLTSAASALAEETDDYSLVGLACRASDSVAIAALRESVVLYAEIVTLSVSLSPKCVWRVDSTLAAAAQRFIDGFNALFGPELPPATAKYAHVFGLQDPHITGRCVRLGQTPDVPPAYYHWAVVKDRDGEYAVHEFWSSEIWTTERFRKTPQPVMPQGV